MTEAEWRDLAHAALRDLPEMHLDSQIEADVKLALTTALALPEGLAHDPIRETLTSQPQLRTWLRDLVGDDILRSATPSSGGTETRGVILFPPATDGFESLFPDGEPIDAIPVEDDHTRTVHPRLEAPPTVVAGQTFMLIAGIAAAPIPGVVAVAPFSVPVAAFELTVSLLLDGFLVADGSSPVRTMISSPGAPFPAAVFDLVAVDDPQLRPARSITAVYTADGHSLGTATTSIAITASAAAPLSLMAAAPTAVTAPVAGWAIPGDETPDLVITIGVGNDVAGRRLIWDARSPHPEVVTPAEPVPSDSEFGNADVFALQMMRGVENRADQAGLHLYLNGIGTQIGDQVPQQIWDAVASAAKVTPRPAVLLATAEPFVPWELARAPEAWDTARPPLLGAQVRLGRWIYRANGIGPNPVHEIDVSTMAVVKGQYTGMSRLPEAEAEADGLATTRQATVIPAELAAVVGCIQGTPEVDALHFAVHGKLDVTGQQDGILMNDKTVLSPADILGIDRGRPRFVFANACQVGQSQEMLGATAGIAPSFIRIGSHAVVAPLWKVDDVAARDFSERFYTAVGQGREIADFFAEERAFAASTAAGRAASTVLAYVFFGHPRLTFTTATTGAAPAPTGEPGHGTAPA